MTDFVKNDTGKARFDLIEPLFLQGLADVLTHGAAKYTPDNWRRCKEPVARYYSALQRHLNAYAMGESIDEESGFNHLYHAACCLMFLAWFEEAQEPDDIRDQLAEAMQQRIDALDELTQQAENDREYIVGPDNKPPHPPYVAFRGTSEL
jgi:hypothetical protein